MHCVPMLRSAGCDVVAFARRSDVEIVSCSHSPPLAVDVTAHTREVGERGSFF